MTQAVAYLALHLLGVAFHLGFGPRTRPGLCCALGFLTGLALWVLAALVVIVSPLRYDAVTAAAAYVVPLAVCAGFAARRWRPTRAELAVVVGYAAAFAAATAWLASFDASRFSPDSRNLVVAGLNLGDTGVAQLDQLSLRGGFQIVAHSIAVFTGDGYAWALSSVIGLSIAPILVALAARAAPLPVAALAAGVVFTTYNVTFHLFYVHTNLGAAAYLLGAFGLFWLAERDAEPAYLPGALVCLAAFSLHRVEGPIFAAIAIVVAVFPSQLPRRTLAIGLALYAVPCALWHVYLGTAPSEHLTRSIALVIAAATIGLVAAYLVVPRSLARHAPRAAAAALAIGIAAAAFVRPDAMSTTFRALHANLLDPPLAMWGHTWYVVGALAALCLLVPAPPAGRVLAYGALCTALAIVLLGVRHPYRSGVTDSGNRLALQVLPLAVLYVTVALGPHLRRPR